MPVAQEHPSTLLDRFDLLIASKESGNTGLDEELLQIATRLNNMKELDKEQYEELVKYIKS